MKAFDIVVMTDQAFLSRVIHFFVGKWSHVFIALTNDMIVHADGGEVRKEILGNMLAKSPKYELVVLRLKPEYQEQFSKIKAMQYVESQLKEKYNTMNAIGRGVYRFLSWFGINRKGESVFYDDKQLICSVFGGGMYEDQGLEIKKNVHWTQLEPADVLASDLFDVAEIIKEGDVNGSEG